MKGVVLGAKRVERGKPRSEIHALSWSLGLLRGSEMNSDFAG